MCIHDSYNNKKYVIMYSLVLVLHVFGSVHLIKYNYKYNISYYVKYKSKCISNEISNKYIIQETIINFLCNNVLLIILIVVISRH